MKTIILASSSPRRKRLLEKIGLKFKIVPSNLNEQTDQSLEPIKLVKSLSLKKAKDIAKREKNAIIIAADTIVVFNNQIIGKPKDESHAKEILKRLSDRPHFVITGFTIINSTDNKTITRSVKTTVYMKKMTDKEINDYIKTKEPLDKAGAYGIQGLGGKFITKIKGDFFNVVGLPLPALMKSLKKFGINGKI